MRIIRIEAVTAQMKFDLSRFTVAAGEDVVIEFVNRDEMPHNLLVTKEGALETVGLAAEAMVSLPDAFGKNFIPKTPEVLFAIRLLQPGETLQARFTAPTQPGNYPVRLHVPRPLADDERHRRGGPAAAPGVPSHDASRLPPARDRRRVPRRPGAAVRRVVAQARAPHVVFVTGDDEYRSEITMPMIAAILEKHHGLRTSVAFAKPTPQTKDHIEGLEALETADLMVMFTRFRALPDDELDRDHGVRDVRQADGRLPHEHARVPLPGGQPARRL